jgi:NAD(P)-dependent dehydrogenase (short-subunit alcohol dehydrogenase family)
VHNLLRFDGKTIALTGAASGIGAATLQLFNATGADVHAIDLAPLPGGRHTSHRADLGDPGSVAALIEQLPTSVDVLVNCAGLPNGGRFTTEQIVAVNWFGLRMLTEGVLPNMPEGSSVVHVASTAARNWRQHQPELAELLTIESFDETMAWVAGHADVVGDGYGFSKEAVVYYMLQRSATSVERGVRMNSVSPGVTDTPIAADFVAGVGAEAIDKAIANAGRIAQPEEMAPALLFLADELSSSFINGIDITLDRGVKAARILGEF